MIFFRSAVLAGFLCGGNLLAAGSSGPRREIANDGEYAGHLHAHADCNGIRGLSELVESVDFPFDRFQNGLLVFHCEGAKYVSRYVELDTSGPKVFNKSGRQMFSNADDYGACSHPGAGKEGKRQKAESRNRKTENREPRTADRAPRTDGTRSNMNCGSRGSDGYFRSSSAESARSAVRQSHDPTTENREPRTENRLTPSLSPASCPWPRAR